MLFWGTIFVTMQSKMTRIICGLVLGFLGLNGVTGILAQTAPPPASAPKPAEPLVWDSLQKESSPKVGSATADFIFSVTNVSDNEVIVDHTQGSCSCTVAKLPSQPWHLPPHTNGQINVTADLARKSGTL